MEIYEENAISTRSYNLRVLNLRERGRLGSLKFNRVRSGGGDDEDDALVERQLLYRKLPDQHLLNLSVLKLDGSLFDVNIGRNATVAELKVAIEELFTEMAAQLYNNPIPCCRILNTTAHSKKVGNPTKPQQKQEKVYKSPRENYLSFFLSF